MPLEVGSLVNLQSLDVSEKNLTGERPTVLGMSLEFIYLQGNFLQGHLPSSLGSLRGLQVLDVSHNNISGEIPDDFEKLIFLKNLNLSLNNLEGEDPITGIFQIVSVVSAVLLGNDMTAHVGDFGLAKFLPKSTSTSNKSETNSIGVGGTIGYIPPEYGIGAEVSTLGDVYSYGVLLLEIFTGKRPTDHLFKEGLSLHGFSEMASASQGNGYCR